MFGNEEIHGLIHHVNEEIFNKAASSDPDTSYKAEIRYKLANCSVKLQLGPAPIV